MFLRRIYFCFFCALTLVGHISAHAAEVLPTQVQSRHGKATGKVNYVVKTAYSELYISTFPFEVENETKNSGFNSEIGGGDCERVEKVYKQKTRVYVVTYSCAGSYGNQSDAVDYVIYEFNDSAKLVSSKEIHFDEGLDISIAENGLNNGIKIFSNISPKSGRRYNYEFRKGQLYDFSTSMNQAFVEKENERLCLGFYEVFLSIKHVYDPSQALDNPTNQMFSILGTAQYSWVSHAVKSDDFLSDQLLSLVKVTTPEQRKEIPYKDFKDKYCD